MKITIFFLIFINLYAFASDLKIGNVIFISQPGDANPNLFVTYTVPTQNYRKKDKNHDGIGLIFKLWHQNELRINRYACVSKDGNSLLYDCYDNDIAPSPWVSNHAAGTRILPSKKDSGNINWKIKNELDTLLTKGKLELLLLIGQSCDLCQIGKKILHVVPLLIFPFICYFINLTPFYLF